MKVTKQAQFLRKDGHIDKKIKYVIKQCPDTWERGKFGDEYRLTLEDSEGTEFCFPAWQQHMNVLIDAFGDETDQWVGKSVVVSAEQSKNKDGKPIFLWTLSSNLTDAITEKLGQ